MCIILGEAAHPHDSVQSARRLVSMARTEFSQAQRQVTITLETLVENLHVSRTIHRLNGVVPLFRFSGEHQFAIVFPMSGTLPQRTVHNLWCAHFLVAVVRKGAAHVLFDLLPDCPTLGMPKHHAGCFFLGMKQIELLAELAMVSLFRL